MKLPALLSAAVVAVIAASAPTIAPVARAAASNASRNSPFGDLHWRLIGPFRAGRTLAVTGVPGQPRHFYFGSVNGGVWETNDTGRTWNPIFDSQDVGSIGAIAVAPSNPNVIYVGSGEADMRSDIAQGKGMYKSVDAGKSWSKIGLTDTQQIGMIRVDPRDPNRVFVAALGHPYGPNAQRGVFRSLDGGNSWKKVLGPNDDTGAIDLIFKPGDANTIYASLWQTRRPPWNVYPPSNGPGSGLYKSTDGGEHWTQLTNGFASKHVGRIGIAISDAAPDRIYAVVDADDGGLYRSDDAGAHWKKTSSDPRIWQRGWYFGQITADPKNPDRVYAMNTIELRSDDGGKTFLPVKGDPTGDDYHELWIDPNDPDRQIMGVDQGTIITVNGGKTWSSWFNQPTAQLYHVSTDNRFPYRVYGAQQDSGAVGIPSRAPYNDRISMEQFHEVTAGGESGMIAPDPDDPDIVYGGTVDKLDLKTEQTRSVDPTLADPDIYRHTWTLPLAFNAKDHRVLYFGNQKLWRTDDGGEHWSAISPDLSREDPGVPANLDAVTAADNLHQGARRGVVYAIGSSPLDEKLLWVGTDDGLIWRTGDEGAHWDNVTPKALTPWSKVGIIEPSHFDANSAYAAIDRHRLGDRRPYIYRTHDGGITWSLIVSGIRDGDFVNVVREDPARKGLLYAGTELGMYVSFDDGDHWQPLQQNLPRTSVRDIDVHGDDLVIATHGRAFWVMDDIAPLRQSAGSAPFLFKPATSIRERAGGFFGSPMPKDEAMAPNPSFGAYIDYVANGAPVTLEIFDANNNLVRAFNSETKPEAPNLQRLTTAPEWVTPPQTLSTTPGMHRFVWSLHYAPPAGVSSRRSGGEGVWAPPGEYRVVLTSGGQKLTQTLTVAPDPRLNLPQQAYIDEFNLARDIESLRARLAAATEEATSVGKNHPDLLAQINRVTGGPTPNVFPPPPVGETTMRFIAEKLSALQSAVDGADAAPSADARAAWGKLRLEAESALQAWTQLKSGVK